MYNNTKSPVAGHKSICLNLYKPWQRMKQVLGSGRILCVKGRLCTGNLPDECKYTSKLVAPSRCQTSLSAATSSCSCDTTPASSFVTLDCCARPAQAKSRRRVLSAEAKPHEPSNMLYSILLYIYSFISYYIIEYNIISILLYRKAHHEVVGDVDSLDRQLADFLRPRHACVCQACP